MGGQIQSTYQTYPEVGFPGQIAQGSGTFFVEEGPLYVPANGRKPRPGDALVWNGTQDAFALPTDADESLRTLGILSYRSDTVQSASSILEYEDGDSIQVCVFGTVFVDAGVACEYSDRLAWDRTNFDWRVQSLPAGSAVADLTGNTVANINAMVAEVEASILALRNSLGAITISCVNRDPQSAGSVVLARLGYGRIV